MFLKRLLGAEKPEPTFQEILEAERARQAQAAPVVVEPVKQAAPPASGSPTLAEILAATLVPAPTPDPAPVPASLVRATEEIDEVINKSNWKRMCPQIERAARKIREEGIRKMAEGGKGLDEIELAREWSALSFSARKHHGQIGAVEQEFALPEELLEALRAG